jgi:hypothetical protein
VDDDPESALVKELRALVRPVPAQGNDFTVVHDHIIIAVSYVSGSNKSLTLEAGYDAGRRIGRSSAQPADVPGGYRDAPRALRAVRPLLIKLRPEEQHDVQAKREGLSVEWQAQDPEFDRRVYVETPTTDALVLGAVLNAEVRAATLTLLDLGFRAVHIDDGGRVRTTLVEFVHARPPPADRGRRAVEAFARLIGNLPHVEHTGTRRDPPPLEGWTLALGIVGVAGWALNVGLVGLLVGAFDFLFPHPANATGDPDVLPSLCAIGAGIVGGVMLSAFYGDAVKARVQGRSDAHLLVRKAKLAAFGGGSVLVFVVAFLVVLAAARH